MKTSENWKLSLCFRVVKKCNNESKWIKNCYQGLHKAFKTSCEALQGHIIVCVGVSTRPFFLPSPPLNLQTKQPPPLFRQSPNYIGFSEPPSKSWIFP